MKYLFLLLFIFSTNVLAEVTSRFTINIDNQCNAPVKIFHKRFVIGDAPGYGVFVDNCSEGSQSVKVGTTSLEKLPGMYEVNNEHVKANGYCQYIIEPEWSYKGDWGQVVTPKEDGKTITCRGTVNTLFVEPCKCIYASSGKKG